MKTIDRRTLLRNALGSALLIAPGIRLLAPDDVSAAETKVEIKYDWLISNGQIGDVIAAKNGYFQEAGLEVIFRPGGPNSATVAPVVSGRAQLGQFSETAQLFAARAEGVPVKILACGYRTGPYAFTSLPAKPIRRAADLIGKRIGIQPTARFIIDAILKQNSIDPARVQVINIGFDKAPLVRGEVDALGGWITNTQALSVVGQDRVDLLVRDLGLTSYATVYFATDRMIQSNAELLARFLAAVAKGWEWTYRNPQEAVKKVVAAYPQLSLEWELKTIDLVLQLSFDAETARHGWGYFSPAKLERQLALFDSIGQYKSGRPALKDVYTERILELTAGMRPKLGAPSSALYDGQRKLGSRG